MSAMIEPSESDKRSIYKHPLFPLMALLFERCEQVTQTPDCPLVANLKVDIQSFVHHHQQRLVDFEQSIGERPEVDSLMIKAIQILWIHLLELDKVNELCKDFCTRYISCLRTKLQNEQLLHIDAFESDSNDIVLQPNDTTYNRNNSHLGNTNGNGGQQINYGDIRVPQQQPQPQHTSSRDSLGLPPDVGMNRSIDMRGLPPPPPSSHHSHFQDHHHDQQVDESSFYRHKNKMDDIQPPPAAAAMQQLYPPSAAPPTTTHDYMTSDQQQQQSDSILLQQSNNSLSMGMNRMGAVSPTILASLEALDDGDYDQKTKTKRGILPKQATRVLKTWLFQHLLHPYPTDDEKKLLADHTSLSVLQVNNWFINARRRILQPIVDANNQEGPPKAKKMKPNNNNNNLAGGLGGSTNYQQSYSPDRAGGYKRSDSRSETSTPTSTTFDCDHNSLSECSTKQQDDDDNDNDCTDNDNVNRKDDDDDGNRNINKRDDNDDDNDDNRTIAHNSNQLGYLYNNNNNNNNNATTSHNNNINSLERQMKSRQADDDKEDDDDDRAGIDGGDDDDNDDGGGTSGRK